MAVVKAKGTLLQHGVAGSPATYTTIASRVTIDGPDMSVAEIDTTDLDSAAMTNEPGLPDAGEVSMTVNYAPTAVTHKILFDAWATPVVDLWQLVFADGTKYPFNGWVKKFKPTGVEVNGKLQAEVTFRITGTITPTYPP